MRGGFRGGVIAGRETEDIPLPEPFEGISPGGTEYEKVCEVRGAEGIVGCDSRFFPSLAFESCNHISTKKEGEDVSFPFRPFPFLQSSNEVV